MKIPTNLVQHADYPLHLLVAIWAMKNNIVLMNVTISREFCITQARAEKLINLIEQTSKKIVSFEKIALTNEYGHSSKCLKIISVALNNAELNKPQKTNTKKINTNTKKTLKISSDITYQKLRQWVIYRRVGDRIPDDLMPFCDRRTQDTVCCDQGVALT